MKEMQGAAKVLRDKIDQRADSLASEIKTLEDEHLLVDGITRGKNPQFPNLKSFLSTFYKNQTISNADTQKALENIQKFQKDSAEILES